MWTSRRALPAWGALIALLPSCAGMTMSLHEKPRAPKPVPVLERSSPAVETPVDTSFVSLSRQGSSVALARVGGRLVAYVADRLAKRLDVVDVAAHKSLGAVVLGGEPVSVLALADRRLIVSLSDRSALQVVDVDAGLTVPKVEKERLVDVSRGPTGLAVSDDGKLLAVTSTYAAEVAILDAATLAPIRTVHVPRSPSGVVIEEGRAFVSHLAGDAVSVIDLATASKPRAVDLKLLAASERATPEALGRLRHASQGYALTSVVVPPRATGEASPGVSGRAPVHRIIAPGVSVDPGDTVQAVVYYGPPPTAGISKVTPVVMTIDAKTEKLRAHDVLALADKPFDEECLLPRGATFRQSSNRLYVACRGIDKLLELDASAADPMRSVLRRFDLSKGVTGIAVADDEGLAVTFGEFDGKLDIVSLDERASAQVDLSEGAPELSGTYRKGRELFYRTNDKSLAFDGVGCATCHPDGGEDSLTWNTPEGLRQTPMLAGRLVGTSPYGWSREMRTLPDYIGSTIERLGGSGLSGTETAELATYLEEMEAPPSQPAHTEEVARGAEVWRSAGCASCHVDGVGVDRQSHSFDASHGRVSDPLDANTIDTRFDTPSLRFIGLTAPYFHDGRYKTLEEVVSDPRSQMGSTARLSRSDRKALVQYLEAL